MAAPPRKLPLSKVLLQGGFRKPKTLTDVADGLSLKAQYLRRLPSLKGEQRTAEEREYGTRNGLISEAGGKVVNPYHCILKQKKTLQRVRAEITHIDRTVAEIRLREIQAKGKKRAASEASEQGESIFLTSLMTPQLPHISTSFSRPRGLDSVSTLQHQTFQSSIPELPQQHTALSRSLSLNSTRAKIKEISAHCNDISKSVVESKIGLERDMKVIKSQLDLFTRHLSVMEIERRRRKYFLLRKTFQMDTKVGSTQKHMKFMLGSTGMKIPTEMEVV